MTHHTAKRRTPTIPGTSLHRMGHSMSPSPPPVTGGRGSHRKQKCYDKEWTIGPVIQTQKWVWGVDYSNKESF